MFEAAEVPQPFHVLFDDCGDDDIYAGFELRNERTGELLVMEPFPEPFDQHISSLGVLFLK
jgi:hypothetical protein